MIELIENYLPQDSHNEIWNYCLNASYKVGERDYSNTLPTGIVHEIPLDSHICNILTSSLKKNSLLESKSIYRCYINCFSPNENPYWHTDGEGITCLYYPNITYSELNEGGETQFLLDNNEIKGILPFSNRMVLFDGLIYHKATSFRTQHRYTIALKYQ